MYVRDQYEEQAFMEGVVFLACLLIVAVFTFHYPYQMMKFVLWAMAVSSGSLALAALFHGLRDWGRR